MILSIQTNTEFFHHLPDERSGQWNQTIAGEFPTGGFIDHNPLSGVLDAPWYIRSEP
jgi:hypothetical protein